MARGLDFRCASGGILRLRELISEHPAELAYDFRARFQLSIFDVGITISWLEAAYLVGMLVRHTDSWTHAVVAEWDYPVSREWVVAAHTFDLLATVNSGKKKPKAYPAPWPDSNVNKIGSKKPQNTDRVLSMLEQMNPTKD